MQWARIDDPVDAVAVHAGLGAWAWTGGALFDSGNCPH